MKEVLIRPLVTEKVSRLTERTDPKQYGFVVEKDANKIEIRTAIEQKYSVNVRSIRTMITTPRTRRRYSKTGVVSGKTSNYKKAFVTLMPGETIDLYSNV